MIRCKCKCRYRYRWFPCASSVSRVSRVLHAKKFIIFTSAPAVAAYLVPAQRTKHTLQLKYKDNGKNWQTRFKQTAVDSA